MPAVTITETPQSLAALLAVEGRGFDTLWSGICQNASATKTVYRLRSATQPDRVAAAAFRHRPGEIFRLALWSAQAT